MRIRFIKDPCGMYNLAYGPGEETDLPDAQAREIIETGHAVPVEFKPQTEKATSRVKPEKR